MRVLFTSPILEHPPAGGPQLRIENSVKALSRVCDLHVISRAPTSYGDLDPTAEFFRSYCQEFKWLPRLERGLQADSYIQKIARIARRLLHLDVQDDADFILEHVDRNDTQVIWFGYGNISFPLIRCIRSMRPTLKLVCDTDSVWSRFVLRELPYAKGLRKLRILHSGRAKQLEERAWVELCNVTTAVSDVDARYYRELASDADRIHVFSNVIDVESYKHHPVKPEGFKNPSIYLAGTFGHAHSPMDSAARWVIEEVYPILLKAYPNLHFYIVGNNSDRGFGHLNGPNITATGRLVSVLPYLCHADVALVPLKFESGTRFKILEAGACRIPLVSTTLGAEGIPVVDGHHVLIADEPQAFANAVLRLLDDKAFAVNLANNCGQLVNEHFSVESLALEARKILRHLDEPQRQSW